MTKFCPVLLLPFLLIVASIAHSRPLCTARAGSVPLPSAPKGKARADIPVQHILVLMQENRSFDHYWGKLNLPQFYGHEVDGLKDSMSNTDKAGTGIPVFHQTDLCAPDLDHSWEGMHTDWNNGKNDQFALNMGRVAMGYYDQSDIPFYYELANQFAIADRYFCPAMGPTYPNRFFLWTGTAFGNTGSPKPKNKNEFRQKTIFDVLDKYKISWRYYTDYFGEFAGGPGYLALFQPLYRRSKAKVRTLEDFATDAKNGTLPDVAFIDANENAGEDEHPNANPQIGQAWVAARLQALMNSPSWKDSVLFLTYDENGGFFDHVAPPSACPPDNHLPRDFDRYGFRVPFLAVSPFAKRHFVSHKVYDHTSILKFIETKYNLPALTGRDANADGLLDMFDFSHPNYALPKLPFSPQVKACK